MGESDEGMYLELLTDATALLRRCGSAEEAIEAVANLVLPLLGDVCFVDLVEHGRLHRIERAAALPDKRERLRGPAAAWPLAASNPVYEVLLSGKALVAPLVGEEILRRIAVDATHLESLHACGPKALLSAPLFGAGEPLGVLTFASAQPRAFDDLDVRFVCELACHLGSKLEHLVLSKKLAELEARDAKP
jgi:GAF domain-containing protein